MSTACIVEETEDDLGLRFRPTSSKEKAKLQDSLQDEVPPGFSFLDCLDVCSQCGLLMMFCCILAFLADNTGGGSFQPYQKVLVFRGFAQARQSTPCCYHRLSYSELITLRYKCHQLELWLASKPA